MVLSLPIFVSVNEFGNLFLKLRVSVQAGGRIHAGPESIWVFGGSNHYSELMQGTESFCVVFLLWVLKS